MGSWRGKARRVRSAEAIGKALAEAEQPLRTPAMRRIAREAARTLREADAAAVYQICDALVATGEYWQRAAAFELAAAHRGVREALNRAQLEQLSRTVDEWSSADHFARLLSGPAWRRGQLTDADVHQWAQAENEWRQRMALVSTIALNERDQGQGDAERTLAMCDYFKGTREPMKVKALSWVLRELAKRDAGAAAGYVERYGEELSPRVRREVGNKLRTGHKQGKPSAAMQRRHQAVRSA